MVVSFAPRSPEQAIQTASDVFCALRSHHLVPLLDEICLRRRVLVHDLCGRARTRSVQRARHELWWAIRHHPDLSYSYSEIARLFRCDPSTVLSGVRGHARRRTPAGGPP